MIEVTKYHGPHQGGTKDYTLYLFVNKAHNKGMLVKRYGKIHADGQLKKEPVVAAQVAGRELDKALRERDKKGYAMVHDVAASKSYDCIQDALSAVMPFTHARAFYNNELAVLDPDNVTAGATKGTTFDPLKDERDRLLAEAQAAEAETRLANEKAELAAAEADLKSNPLYGMF